MYYIGVRHRLLICTVIVPLQLSSCVTDAPDNFFDRYPSHWELPTVEAGKNCDSISGVYYDSAESSTSDANGLYTLSGVFLDEELPEVADKTISLHYDSGKEALVIRSGGSAEPSGTSPQIRRIEGTSCKSGWLEFYEDYSGYGDGSYSKGGVRTSLVTTSEHLIIKFESDIVTNSIPLVKTRHASETYLRFAKADIGAKASARPD